MNTVRIPELRRRRREGEGGGFSISSHGGPAASHDGIIVCRDLSPPLPPSLPDRIPKFCFSAAINQVSPFVLGWDGPIALSQPSSLALLLSFSHRHYVHSSLTSGAASRMGEGTERGDRLWAGERKEGRLGLNKHRIYTIAGIRFVLHPFSMWSVQARDTNL